MQAMRALIAALLLFALAAFTAAPARAADAPQVLIAYRDKAPYSYTENGQPVGQLNDKTRAIFQRAGLDLRFEEMPSKRIALELRNNNVPLCSPGWYRLPEREVFAGFSKPIQRDRPQVVLASVSSAPKVRAHAGLQALLNDKALLLTVIDEISYGPEIDLMIRRAPRPPLRATATSEQLARMVAAERADYMLVDQDDLDHLKKEGETRGLVDIHFADTPAGLYRHLWCSKKVDRAMMERINGAIGQLGYDSPR